MAEHKFKIGAVVELKSGGPKMTVLKYRNIGSTLLTCTWFEELDYKTQEFEEDMLKHVPS